MSLLGMPLLIMNMGGEMIYILEQRLVAQSITREKSKKVLQDVVKLMFTTKFVEELFKPQELYSNTSIRGIFDRLAHSSIMRLNEASMDKLYDLMTMGVKYQLVCSTYPAEMIDITYNHIENIRSLVDDPAIEALVDHFWNLFKQRYEPMSAGDWIEVRQTLHRYFQDRRIRVSLFMRENLQSASGYMIFPKEEEVPPGCEVPGRIRNYVGDEVKVNSFTYLGTAKPRTRTARSKLGVNLYVKGTPLTTEAPQPATPLKETPPAYTPPATASPTPAPAPATPVPSAPPVDAAELSELPSTTGKLGAAELDLLAALVNPQPAADKDVVRVNLFGTDKLGLFELDKQSDSTPYFSMVTLEPSHGTDIQGLMSDLTVDDPESGEKDLLDLLDDAS